MARIPESMTRAERERAARKAGIVAAADEVFREKGYYDASMDSIAEAAGFTKRTLYQYFATKEDLYFAGMAGIFALLSDSMARAARGRASGLERMEAVLASFRDFYRSDPRRMRLFSLVSQLGGTGSGGPHYALWREASDSLIDAGAALVAEGQADGSLRPELDGRRTAYSVVFLTTAFFSLLAVNGESFARSRGMGADDLQGSAMGLLADASASRGARGREGGAIPSSGERR